MAERGRTKKGAFPMIAKKNQGKFRKVGSAEAPSAEHGVE